uniref:Uncharacterized protein n=1 Tax=Chromera velia CCMP2878 TaxID=1169474 RepID=A0A0G4FGB0_9ALVE|eukprot:Cvel_16767.t1-p1 / transcript=Cvel_16767.t1 / gene=Cvel_16767 / organism=Chromera_velia_CCMP2878 / gene_product=hypothetical protein / transcript_product=hypothetical protein / location=Cvel_scaffold1308:608-1030(-) / protein_length=141 / sequence_SO=supercontig / SO=protein_coding / is_pseudo=false
MSTKPCMSVSSPVQKEKSATSKRGGLAPRRNFSTDIEEGAIPLKESDDFQAHSRRETPEGAEGHPPAASSRRLSIAPTGAGGEGQGSLLGGGMGGIGGLSDQHTQGGLPRRSTANSGVMKASGEIGEGLSVSQILQRQVRA